MKLVVTGAAGFIGSHAAQALAQEHDVLGIDNVNDYYDQDQKRANIALIREDGVAFEERDIRDEKTQELIVDFSPDAIVHLAAMAGVRYSIQHPELYTDVNVNGTQRILNAAKATGAYAVLASSSSVYGARTEAPFKETDSVEEQVSPYAASKRSTELLANVHHHLTGLPVTCLRFFTVYGPRGRPDMAPYKFMRMIADGEQLTRYGDGSSARDYMYIDDIVSGIIGALENPGGYEIYNLGNSEVVDLNTFIQTIEDVMGREADIVQLPEQPGDVPLTSADISKAREHLGYDPQTSIREGLAAQYAWFREHRD